MVINELKKYKSLTLLFLYIISLAGCSSYGPDMNMSGIGQGGDDWGERSGRANRQFSLTWRGRNVRQDFEEMLRDAIIVRDRARESRRAFIGVGEYFERLASENESLINHYNQVIQALRRALQNDELPDCEYNDLVTHFEEVEARIRILGNGLTRFRDNVNTASREVQGYRDLYNTYNGIVPSTRALINRFNSLGN